jgi:hypothetical protein
MIHKLKTKYLIELIAFAFVFMVIAFPVLASEITAKKVIQLVNAERQKRDLPSLLENETLSRVAEKKAKDMIDKDYFAHTSPEGKTPWHWFSKENYDYRYAGENLAINFVSAEKQMDAWMKSESHKKNILSENFSEIGVAVAAGKIDGKEAIVTVQEFGTPVSVSVGKKVENKKTTSLPRTDFAKDAEIVPTVLSDKKIVPTKESLPQETNNSSWKIGVIEIAQGFFLFISFIAISLAPMAFLAKAFERMWFAWEMREKKVRVRYVN